MCSWKYPLLRIDLFYMKGGNAVFLPYRIHSKGESYGERR